MKLSHSMKGDIRIVEVFGDVDTTAANQLYDVLVACVSTGDMKLIVDLSEAGTLTRATVRGLIVASKLFRTLQGEIRICGAAGEIGDLLMRPGSYSMLSVDCDRETAVRCLCQEAPCVRTAPRLLTSLRSRLRQLAA